MGKRAHLRISLGKIGQAGLRSSKEAGKRALCIWDGSRIEKPASEKTEGMCAVLSSKAKRLKKNRKGVWNPPGGKPVTVLGLEWSGLLIAGMQGVPEVATMEYWSRKGGACDKSERSGKTSIMEDIPNI